MAKAAKAAATAAATAAAVTVDFDAKTLDGLPRKELQTLAKRYGVKGNGKSVDIIWALEKIAAEAPAVNETEQDETQAKKVVTALPERDQLEALMKNLTLAAHPQGRPAVAVAAPTGLTGLEAVRQQALHKGEVEVALQIYWDIENLCLGPHADIRRTVQVGGVCVGLCAKS